MQQACQTLVFQCGKSADIEYTSTYCTFIEKVYPAQIEQHPGYGLGYQSYIKYGSTRFYLIKADLIAKDRFSSARRSFDDVQTAFDEPALQNLIQTLYPGGYPLQILVCVTHLFFWGSAAASP